MRPRTHRPHRPHRPRRHRLRLRHRIAALLWLLLAGFRPGVTASDAAPTGILRVSLLDDVTGQPTAATVHLVDAAGRLVTRDPAFKGGFRCADSFTERLPAGTARLRVTRGFETRAVERAIRIPADGRTNLTLRLDRTVDLRARGWFGGDSHAHMLHGERRFPVGFDDLALAARAADLQYLSVAQTWSLNPITPERLEAEFAARSRPDCVLTWNLEQPKNYYRGDAGRCLGHGWTLGLRGRTPTGGDVIQLLRQANAADYESAKPPFANFESHRLIHEQGGRVFYSHPARAWTGPWGGRGGYARRERMRISNLAAELPLDLLLGPTFDGLDLITSGGEWHANEQAFRLWCLLLNHGYRLAGTASSDACFDRPGGAVPGTARTYTRLDGPFSLAAVADATARGRTFVTTGPLLLAELNGRPPGSSFPADGRERTLRLEAWASGEDAGGLSHCELYRNGVVVRTHRFDAGQPQATLAFPLTEREDAWYCVRLYGSDPRRQRAISGAFFFETAPHQPPPPVPATVEIALLDAATGAPLRGAVTEMTCSGPRFAEGPRHPVNGRATLTVPGDRRLRGEAPGHTPAVLSPFLDDPPLRELITGLEAKDLLDWGTYERVATRLAKVRLTFRLPRRP